MVRAVIDVVVFTVLNNLRAIADPSRDPVTGLLPARLVVRDSMAAPGR